MKDYPQPGVDPVEPVVQEITYDYTKTCEDYFSDYEIPTKIADISKTTVTGSGTETDPYIINSTEDFLFMSKQTFNSKYIELNCDIILNDETFDENGLASGGDGDVYTWQPITTWVKCHFNGKGHTISGVYFNDSDTTLWVGLFNSTLASVKNLTLNNVFFVRKRGRLWSECKWHICRGSQECPYKQRLSER